MGHCMCILYVSTKSLVNMDVSSSITSWQSRIHREDESTIVSLCKASGDELNHLPGQGTRQLAVLDPSTRARLILVASFPLLHEVRTCV